MRECLVPCGKGIPAGGWVLWVAREKRSRQSETLDCWHGAENISNAWPQLRTDKSTGHAKNRTYC